ncbi:MAG: FAD-dependent thymidylate synthase [Bacteroidota bacterium]|nr:FAD-dependent thymidylate synthase [Candidatus Kapabacteria bacterium]MDW8219805.1 FAD-dependent thymidylate synthase [Bacteroidota bacterium]
MSIREHNTAPQNAEYAEHYSNTNAVDGKSRTIHCLDKGFVRLVDYMGSDAAIVQAARVSYGAGTKQVHEDRGLIRYLMRHAHTTPFEMVEFKFHVKLPIFVARQWIRHRTANVNEYSGRYSVMPDEFYLPDIEQIRPQSHTNKQGRADEALPKEKAEYIRTLLHNAQERSYKEYGKLLEENLTRELARINLPVSQYTEWYWKIDLHNLFHFLRLRLDSHAQYEIRVYAQAIAQIVRDIVPYAYEAFEDYVLYAVRLTRPELHIMRRLLSGLQKTTDMLVDVDSITPETGLSKREVEEFRDKLARMTGSKEDML